MQNDKEIIVQIMKGLQWTSGTAAVVIGILLAATLVQMHIHAPVTDSDYSAFTQLIDRNPSDQNLREEVRALDMLARRAYFTSLYQIRFGTIIFFIAAAIFLIMWNIRITLFPAPPAPPGEKVSCWKRQTQSAKTVALTSAAIVAAAALFGINHKYQLTSTFTAKRGAIVDSDKFSQWWMNFRGPGGTGIAVYANAPVRFDGETMAGIKWKTETPLEGFSSPVVYNNKVFLTGGSKDIRQVYCFDVNDGALLWARDVKISNQPAPKVDKETGYAAPTAACDGKNVYAIFATGELAAFTLAGKQVWARFLGIPDNHYGHSSSLITANGLLYVQLDEYDNGKLLALDTKTGKTVWEATRTVLSWASPILINTGVRRELILVDNEYASSYDPASGKMLWNKDCLYGEVGPSAAFANGMVFTANEYASATGIDVVNTDEEGKPAVRWSWRGDLPNTASPAAIDSLLFLATATGIVSCINTNSGETLWTHIFDRGFYSSPIISGGSVLLFDRNGLMHAFAAAAEFELITSSAIGEPVMTTPAVLDGYLIVRGNKYLYRIDGNY
ncbi:MAG: PQQ-binding-like beta-propeller repeat protein [Chitinispirillia bacterium]|nr:PQQ-binding-like beta-propeller repeat protein [Chitinispirillia bacterium]MCL2269108.1 PQQ-binding-like beta-propeller repeat protein [Chitinispirillia bacterium]